MDERVISKINNQPKPQLKPTHHVANVVTQVIHQTQNQQGTKRALLIGINYFGSEYELHGCLNDVDRTSEMLQRCFGFLKSNITILKDSPTDPMFRASTAPTRQNIMQSIQSLMAATQPGDLAYFHYSGHGSHQTDQNGEENDHEDESICPVDMDQIIDDELHILFVEALAVGAKLRCVFDCCHSGTILDLKYRERADKQSITENLSARCKTAGCDAKDVIMISGCMDAQTSADAYIKSKYSGALTWGLVEIIDELTNRGGVPIPPTMTWDKIITDIDRKLAGSRYEQIPQLSYMSESILKQPIDL
jgi:hypothetical protein